jgi:hypothetical protein
MTAIRHFEASGGTAYAFTHYGGTTMRIRTTATVSALLLATLSVTHLAIAAPPTSSPPEPRTEIARSRGATNQAPFVAARDRSSAPSTPKAASASERASYAAREAASPDAKNYKGGDEVVIIGASTTALILGIVLLVVLLH